MSPEEKFFLYYPVDAATYYAAEARQRKLAEEAKRRAVAIAAEANAPRKTRR
jgi:hypothetical protein